MKDRRVKINHEAIDAILHKFLIVGIAQQNIIQR